MSTKINNEYIKVIENRTLELIDLHPELEKDLHNYLDLQKEECKVLEDEFEGMIWVLQKAAE